MKGIIKALLGAGLIIAFTKRIGGEKKLDTALFLRRYSFKTLESMSDLLSSMNTENLTSNDIYRLAAYAGMTPKAFAKEYVVVI